MHLERDSPSEGNDEFDVPSGLMQVSWKFSRGRSSLSLEREKENWGEILTSGPGNIKFV